MDDSSDEDSETDSQENSKSLSHEDTSSSKVSLSDLSIL